MERVYHIYSYVVGESPKKFKDNAYFCLIKKS